MGMQVGELIDMRLIGETIEVDHRIGFLPVKQLSEFRYLFKYCLAIEIQLSNVRTMVTKESEKSFL
jgi:hypothetical protein